MNPEQKMEDMRHIKLLVDAGDCKLAWSLLEPYLLDDPNDAMSLWQTAHLMEKGKNLPVAWQLAKRVTELQPERFAGWLQYGYLSDQLWQDEIAERSYRRALRCAKNAEEKSSALMSLAGLYIRNGEFARAEPVCKEALLANPEGTKAKANLGFCQLAARNWAEGWANYHHTLGTPARKRVQYDEEPEWDGSKGFNVAFYGEQGIGDEISFASMIPDAVKDCNKVIIDCDSRLKNLFQRSFPEAVVYETRTKQSLEWKKEDRSIHASLPLGGLGGLYRLTDDSFPGTPYLVPDPERVLMWEALWKTKNKPVIGIAWTGGLRHTAAQYRQWTLEDLLPIFKSIDAHWVCLQYKDAAEEILAFKEKHDVDLVQYPYATLTEDYDDTAALVASLDRVVSMQTAVVHLCGAIGKQCDVFVPKNSQWRYGEGFTSLPWYSSVNVIRQAVRGHWKNTIEAYARTTRAELGETSDLRVA